MGTNITFYDLRLVKEKSGRYDVDRKISGPKACLDYATEVLELDTYAEECFVIITLNNKNFCTGVFKVSKGSINSAIVHPREVYKRALLNNAVSIIAFHNHPSGNPEPSSEDTAITKRLIDAGELIGIRFLDHIIVGSEGDYYSFKENGEI